MSKFKLDGKEYDLDELNEKCKVLKQEVDKVSLRIRESQNMQAILTKAKRAYIDDLKSEMLAAKSGFDFSDL